MKMQGLYLKTGALLLILCFVFSGIQAQNENGNGKYFTVSGVVKNKTNKKKMEYVSVTVPGTSIGTVTNEDGEFSLKINESVGSSNIEFSAVGFYNSRVSVSGVNMLNETFLMTPKAKDLDEIIVSGWDDPVKLVTEAINKITLNYGKTPNLLTGFYRETAQKRKNYINVAEAVVNVYKTDYTETTDRDRVQILKGRKLLSTKKSDTLAVKLLGGPNLSVFVDVVKNRDILLSHENLEYFKFTMAEMTLIDDQLNYVVNFEPKVILPYALYYGKLFIDSKSLSFTRAEFNLDMKDRNKATEMILRKKPVGLRFRPEEVSFIVTYKQRDGISYLSYIRNEVKFKCDWNRRLFATNYTIISEMVTTDNQMQGVTIIPRKEAFNVNNSLSDKVMNFYDDDFWGAYNIIEPSESLESAVNKLKKGYK